jgi:hypothetical protein
MFLSKMFLSKMFLSKMFSNKIFLCKSYRHLCKASLFNDAKGFLKMDVKVLTNACMCIDLQMHIYYAWIYAYSTSLINI